MDVISDVLSVLSPTASFTASLTTGGDWAIDFAPFPAVKFTAVLRGSCWLAVEGMPLPIELKTGDCYLLSSEKAYRLASDLSLQAVNAHEIYAHAIGGRAFHGHGQETMLLGGRFSFAPKQPSMLLDTLPPVIHIRSQSTHASPIAWMLERLASEVSSDEPGAALMVDHLAHMLFVQVLRSHLASGKPMMTGWLGALADERIGLALGLMHENPGQRWTLAALTRATGMSRSAFSARFKNLVGTGPLDYLLKWRMQLAAKSLSTGSHSLASIAYSLGYESESAFANAFKRVMGQAPRRYQREVLGRIAVD